RPVAGRQEYCFRKRYANLGHKYIVKELLVGTPPERIVDDICSANGGVLQVGPVERDILRNTVDYDGITVVGALLQLVYHNGFGDNFAFAQFIYFIDEFPWKGIFHPE